MPTESPDRKKKPRELTVGVESRPSAQTHSSHRRVYTAERPYKCSHCPARFPYPKSLKQHVSAVHLKERPFKCHFDSCDKAFPSVAYLKVHERVHTGEKPFACAYCDYRASQSSRLTKHLKSKHSRSVVVTNFFL